MKSHYGGKTRACRKQEYGESMGLSLYYGFCRKKWAR